MTRWPMDVGAPQDGLALHALLCGAAFDDVAETLARVDGAALALRPQDEGPKPRAAGPFLLATPPGSAARAWMLARDPMAGEVTPFHAPGDVSLVELRDHWAGVWRVALGDRPVMRQRFDDPRALGLIVAVARPGQLVRLMGPAVRLWCVVGWHEGRLWRGAAPNEARARAARIVAVDRPDAPPEPPPPDPIVYDAEQKAAFDRDAFTAYLADATGLLRSRLSSAQQRPALAHPQRVIDGAARARAHGLTTKLGITSWLTLDLTLGPFFDQTPEVAALLALDDPMSPDQRIIALAGRVGREPAI